jgi:3-dehydroquinate synthase
VGGKTGVNHTLGKNMIGAFHQPRAVIVDVDTLDTLPISEFSAGMAEVIKYALLGNIDFLSDLEKNIDSIKRGLHQEDKELLIDAIYRSCADKAEIVSVDEFESGVRRLLNLGHTFGHGIENVLGYGTYLHGEAVAIGMCMAARLSQLEGNLSAEDIDRIKNILTLAGLPCSIGKYNITATQLYKAMSLDKKVIDGNIRLVLFLCLGNAYISQDYSEESLKQVLSEFCHS